MTRGLLALCLWLPVLGTGGCAPACEHGRICAIAGNGELGYNGDGPATEVRVASPTSVTTDPDGAVVVIDYSNMRLRRIDADGELRTIVGNGTHAYAELGADRLATPLENPVDGTWGPDGLLYILPQHEGRVIRIGSDGTVEPCVGTGHLSDSGDGGDALQATMGYGGGLSFAPDGTLFISDTTFSRIRRMSPEGQMDTVLGVGSAGLGEPGYGPEVAMRSPERVLVDGDRLLVADTLNHRVLSVDLDTLDTTVLAGTGTAGYSGDGGPATQGTLSSPTGLAVTPDGGVLIADLQNDALRLVSEGTLTTVAGGLPDRAPREVGPPEGFPLRRPAGLHITDQGDLLIAERGGHRVLRWVGAADAR